MGREPMLPEFGSLQRGSYGQGPLSLLYALFPPPPAQRLSPKLVLSQTLNACPVPGCLGLGQGSEVRAIKRGKVGGYCLQTVGF